MRRADHRRAVLAGQIARGGRRPRASSRLSRRAVGSSATRTPGPAAIARASATRSRSPAESRSTARAAVVGEPDDRERVHRPLARLDAVDPAERRAPSSTFSRAVSTPERPGVWPTTPMCSRRNAARASRSSAERTTPPTTHLALVRRVEAGEQREERRLARAGRARRRPSASPAGRSRRRARARSRAPKRRVTPRASTSDAGGGRSGVASSRPRRRPRRPGGARRRRGRAARRARSPMPAARRVSSGTRSQPPRPIDDRVAARRGAPRRPGRRGRARRGRRSPRTRGRGSRRARRRPPRARASARRSSTPARRHLVELAGRLVGDEQRGRVRDRGAERDALLLAARELPRSRVARSSSPTRSSSSRARPVRARAAARRGARAGGRRAPRAVRSPESARQ